MASRQGKKPEVGAEGDKAQRQTYNGHDILIPADPRRKRIFIDGRPVKYGVINGQYYLDVYAYDPTDSLEEVIRRYIDHTERAQRHQTRED